MKLNSLHVCGLIVLKLSRTKQAGALAPLTALESLHVGPEQDEKTLAVMLQQVPTLRHLHMEVQLRKSLVGRAILDIVQHVFGVV